MNLFYLRSDKAITIFWTPVSSRKWFQQLDCQQTRAVSLNSISVVRPVRTGKLLTRRLVVCVTLWPPFLFPFFEVAQIDFVPSVQNRFHIFNGETSCRTSFVVVFAFWSKGSQYQALVIIYNTLIELVNSSVKYIFCRIAESLKIWRKKGGTCFSKVGISHYLLTSILAESLHCRF